MTRTTVRSSSVRTVRTNPRRRRAAILLARAKRGARTWLFWNGRNFSARGRAKTFATAIRAYTKGEQLLRRYRSLRGYSLYVKET